MPRAALVSKEDAIAIFEKYIDDLKQEPLPRWSAEVWKQMSRDLDGKWTAHSVYVNFIQDRRDARSIAFKNCGIEFRKKDEIILNDSTLNESELLRNDESFELEDEAKGLDDFPVLITASEWSRMLGSRVTYGDGRSYPTLKKNVWCDILNLAIQRQIELECCYIFDNHKIYETKGSTHFLRVKGHCKSKECNNSLFCYLAKEPEAGQDFYITVRTRDTLNEKHENVKRPCRGEWRERVGEEAFHEGSGNWQKRQVNAETRFAGRVPAHIPTLSVIRQAKNEYANKKYGIKPTDSKDVVANIEAMRYTPEYKTYIDEVKGNKFFVSFYTPAQLHAYKQYCRFTRKYSTVSIDGTGSLVKPIVRQDGSISGHIFMYAITINFDGTTASVFNFLTESQDTDTLAWGLKRWRDSGGPKPTQAVCDLSRALMNAICLALNYQTVKAYNETCFLFATGNDEAARRSPIHTYLRLDVAHLQAAIKRWDCMKKMKFSKVRHLFQYTVSLMIDCETVDEFEKLWSLLCTVGLHEHRDTILRDGSSVLDAQRELEKKIADRNYEIDTKEEQSETEEAPYGENDIDVQSTETSRVRAFIDRVYNNALQIRREGSDPNPFFFKDFFRNFMLLAYEFCLWTSVALPYVRGHASTCYVEGYFNEVKNRVFTNFSGPIRADKFLKIIYDNELGNATMLNSQLKVCHQTEGPCPSPPQKKFQKVISEEFSQNGSIDSKTSTLEEENAAAEAVNVNNVMKDSSAWVKKLTSNVTGHFSQPQADIAQQNDMTGGCHKLLLMCNGNNVKTPTVIDKEPYFVSNTCGFDSIIQVLSGAAVDDEKYFQFLKNSKSKTLQLILDFIQTGPNKSIYDKRVRILKESFPERIVRHFNEVSPLMSYSINIYDNLRNIWEKTFNSVPSAIITMHCPKCGTYPSQMQTLTVNHITIGSEGFEALKQCEAFNKPKSLRCIKDSCQAECDVVMSYNPQIFVELDVRPDPNDTRGLQCRLSDLPTMINLDNKEYRLAGIIAYSPGHYAAYCYRRMAFWENCDDLKSKIIKCKATLKVEPHAAIYIHSSPRKRKISNVDFTEDEQERNAQATAKTESKKNGKRARTKPIVTDESDEEYFRHSNSQDDPDTYSRDNWRAKEKVDVIFEGTEGDTHADNTDSLDCDIFEVFQVGEFLPGIMNNEIILYVLNTASFDALVHILWRTALHDEYYAAIVNHCTNDMFQFIASLLDDGDSQIQYQNRARILLSLCSSGICEYQEKTGKDGLIGELTVSGTSADFWRNCLVNEPSQWRKYDCNHCGDYIQSIPILEPNERKLSANCVRLQEALEFHQQLKKVKCRRESCPGSCNVDIKTNFHCYINIKNPRRCLLRKLPMSIHMGEDFRLTGVIVMADNRIKAYCPVEDEWWLYDPHHPTIKMTQGLESVDVSGLFYVVKSYYSSMDKVHNIKLW